MVLAQTSTEVSCSFFVMDACFMILLASLVSYFMAILVVAQGRNNQNSQHRASLLWVIAIKNLLKKNILIFLVLFEAPPGMPQAAMLSH